MKKYSIIAIFILLLGSFYLLTPSFVSAQCPDPKDPNCPEYTGVTDKTQSQAGSTNLTNPLGVTTVPSLIAKVINGVLGVVGSLALLMFVYGGFTWMLSGGNSSAVERGKNILMWAAIGLVVIFLSYALVNFIITTATT